MSDATVLVLVVLVMALFFGLIWAGVHFVRVALRDGGTAPSGGASRSGSRSVPGPDRKRSPGGRDDEASAAVDDGE